MSVDSTGDRIGTIGRRLVMRFRRLVFMFRDSAVVLKRGVPQTVFDRPNCSLGAVARIGLAQNGFEVDLNGRFRDMT